MPKKRKIKEIKSKIKIVKELNKDKSELVEDVEKAEKDFVDETRTSAGFKASSIILDSTVEEGESTAIQRETREREEIEERNITYAPRRGAEETRGYIERVETRENEERREYSHGEDRTMPRMRFEESAFQNRVISRKEGVLETPVTQEFDLERRENEIEGNRKKYRTRRE